MEIQTANGRQSNRSRSCVIAEACRAIAEGVPISEVSRWLGHKSITTAVDLYGHLVPEASGRARDALDKAFPGLRMCPNVPPSP
jgi:integrase